MQDRKGDFSFRDNLSPSINSLPQQPTDLATTRRTSISLGQDNYPRQKGSALRGISDWPNPSIHEGEINPLSLPIISQSEIHGDRDAEHHLVKLTFGTERISPSNITSALEISRLCFPKIEDQIQIAREYAEWVSGNRTYYEPTLEHEIVIHEDLLFRVRGAAVAIGGIYQYPEEPDRMWLSWFGVHPDYRGIKLGAVVLSHCQERAGELGATKFAAYTDDGDSNAHCHLFYERCGYRNTARFRVGHDMMRVYEVSL